MIGGKVTVSFVFICLCFTTHPLTKYWLHPCLSDVAVVCTGCGTSVMM